LCGIATIVLIYQIGRAAFDAATGLWAAWLATLSPVLIVYAREARMYAWLVLVACLCWRLLLGLRHSFTLGKAMAYTASLTALVYSHPLGLLMVGALAIAGLAGVKACFGSWQRWMVVHLAAGALTLPWIGHYLDHPPEFLSGRLPLRYLLGTPIGFLGGNFAVLFGLVVLIAWGIAGPGRAIDASVKENKLRGWWASSGFLLLWLILPPTALYLYSWLSYPIFGPPRYTVFVAPAYLILAAAGLSRTPALVRYPLALGLTILAASELGSKVYDPELKADWRGFAAALAARPDANQSEPVLVLVAAADMERNVEVETARYYLPPGCAAIALGDATPEGLARLNAASIYLAAGSRRGVPAGRVPEQIGSYRFRLDGHYPGLTVWRAED
jgi:hypothetical protein